MYGIAQIARAAPLLFSQHFAALMHMLLSVVMDPSSKDEDNEGITENAILALGAVCSNPFYRSLPWDSIDINQVASIWLQALPLKTDEQVCKLANQQLCDMLENGDPVAYGHGYSNLPQLLRILAENLSSGNDSEIVLHPASIQRMQGITRQMAINVSQAQLEQAFSTLSQQQSQILSLCC
jgi:hypothetical protein